MKKTWILIAVIAVVLFCIVRSCPSPSRGDNKITATLRNASIQEEVSASSPEAEIYIDGSVSMKPYFNAPHPDDLVNTISEIKNLNSDGTSIFFQGNPKPYVGMIANIITNLRQQPHLPESPFYDFFREQACKIDTTNILIYLVTDGIISETSDGGRKNANLNMRLRLKQLQGMIRDALKGHANLAGAIIRYSGKYQGDYWNRENKRVTSARCALLKNEITRPYYVIALGKKEDIRWLQSQPDENLNNPEEKLFMGVHDLAGHQKANFDKEKPEIVDMDADVMLILELPECLKNIEGKDVKVIHEGKDLSIEVTKEGGNKLQAIIKPKIDLKSDNEGCITVSFVMKNKLRGEWLSTWSNDDDMDGPDEISTYGLSTLVHGMFEGLEDEGKEYLKCDFEYKLQ